MIAGSVALDTVKTPFGRVENALGGSATFAGIACSFFSKPLISSVVGSDFPKKYFDLLASKGLDLSGLIVKNGKTFHWEGEYGVDLNVANTLRTDLNVLSDFKPELPDFYKNADFVFLGNIDPDVQLFVLSELKKKPVFVLADTMNHWIGSKRERVLEVVKKADVCLMNDAEARQLFRTNSIVKAGKEILKLDSKVAIIKKGEHGVVMFSDSGFFSCPGYPLEDVLDPTGAGDSFGGSLIGYLAKTKDFSEENFRRGLVYASSIASFNAEDFSVKKLCSISFSDVEKRFNEFLDFVKF